MLTRFVRFIVPTIDIHPAACCQAGISKNVLFFEITGYDTCMNDFNRLFLERKSIRAYEDRTIPESIKHSVREAIRRAPTAGNLMLYSIIEADSPEIKERLSVTCDNQPFIKQAPWVLVFLADYGRMMEYYHAHEVPAWCSETGRPLVKPRESDLLLACCDALIAAQTAAAACEYFGLGTCYIGDIMENWEIHKDLFHLPRYVFPITMLCIGYPTQQQRERPQPGRLSESIVFMRDRYRIPEKAELLNMYTGSGYGAFSQAGDVKNPGQALYDRKFSASYSEEMRRSVRAMLREWQEE